MITIDAQIAAVESVIEEARGAEALVEAFGIAAPTPRFIAEPFIAVRETLLRVKREQDDGK